MQMEKEKQKAAGQWLEPAGAWVMVQFERRKD